MLKAGNEDGSRGIQRMSAKIDEIKSRVALQELVASRGIKLRRTGMDYVGLCPFHVEKTPSFHIFTDSGRYKCFGCGRSGDMIDFIQEIDGLTRADAIKKLCMMLGVDMDKELRKGQRSIGDRLFSLHEEIAAFFHRCLMSAKEAEKAREYILRRKISVEMVERFQLGYVPVAMQALIKWAGKYGYSDSELSDAGILLLPSEEHHRRYNRFGGRLVFPIKDKFGRVVGFSGRTLTEDAKQAKYINSPDTAIFKKGKLLYAMDQAASMIARSIGRRAIVCEGQLDVIRCHANGFANAIASLGTSFTEDQANLLRHSADSVILAFDGDDAGIAATIRVGKILLSAGLAVSVAKMPVSADPDSLIANEGVIAFERCIEEATSIIGFLIAKQEPRLKILDAATAVSCMSKSVLEMISVCPKAVIRAKLLEEASQVLKVPQSDLEHDMCFVSGIPKCDGLVSGELTRREVSSGGYLRLLELSLRVLLSRPELKGNNDIWRILKEGYIDAYVGEETTRRTVNKWMMGAECVLDDNDKEEVEKLALHNEIELSPQSVLMELLRRIWLMHVKSGAHVACEDVERIARSSWSDFCKSIHS